MSDIVDHISTIVVSLVKDGVPKAVCKDLVLKLRTSISANAEATTAGASGHMYELLKWREMIHERAYKKVTSTPLDPANKADVYQQRTADRNGVATVLATQAKWTTAKQMSGVLKNVYAATDQLHGSAKETPGPDDVLLADVVVTNVLAIDLPHEEMRKRIQNKVHVDGVKGRAMYADITIVDPNRENDLSVTHTFHYDGTQVHHKKNVSIRTDVNGTKVLVRALVAEAMASDERMRTLKDDLKKLGDAIATLSDGLTADAPDPVWSSENRKFT